MSAVIGEGPATAVRDWLGDHAPSLPFDILEAARAIGDGGVVREAAGQWTVDPAAAAAVGGPRLSQGVLRRVGALPVETRDLALAAALWGDEAPPRDLGQALTLSPAAVEAALNDLVRAGLVQSGKAGIRFLHDRLRDDIIRHEDPRAVAGLAAAMSDRLAADPVSWARSAAAALHLRRLAGLDDAAPEVWRDRFVQGAADARSRADGAAANAFAECAWRLRERVAGVDAAADRTLLREAILAAADRHEAGVVRERSRILLSMSRSAGDRAEDYELAIAALRLAGESELSWALARQGLAEFGLRIPGSVGWARLAATAMAWRLSRLFGRRARRPPAEDRGPPDPFTRIANAAATVAYERGPAFAAYVAFRGSIRARAKSPQSAFWMSIDTFLLAVLGDFAAAARLGELAAANLDYRGLARAGTLYRALYWGVIWRRPQASLRGRCLEIREMALAEGDLVYVANAIRNHIMIGWRTVSYLPDFEIEVREALRETRRIGDADIVNGLQAVLVAVRSLVRPRLDEETAGSPDGPDPSGEAPNQPLVAIEAAGLRGDVREVLRVGRVWKAARSGFDSHPGGVAWRFHESLALLRTGQPARKADLAYIRRAARLNPADHLARRLWLRAEELRRRNRPAAALAAYGAAVNAADAGSAKLEAGLAAACAADAARAAGRPDLARHYHDHAQAIWAATGATALLDDPAVEARADAEAAALLAEARAQVLAAHRDARSKSRFLADVAHELRTPMQGLLDVAAYDPAGFDLSLFAEVFSSLKTVVDDLTDLGALASGELRVTPAPVSLAGLVRAEVGILQPAADRCGFAWTVRIDPACPGFVVTDGHRVRQVVRNLLSNAVKYGGSAGGVALSPDPSDPARMLITVEDSGPGLSAGELLRLFEPFDRGGREGDGQGLGLGLTLSRQIARSLGGGLDAENRPEGGARFLFTFHVDAAPDAAGDAASAPSAGLNILLAEDEPLIRRVVAALLTWQGHRVVEASDGLDAARFAAAETFDLLILDLSMPRMGGLDLLRLLDRTGGAPPCIVLTASSDDGNAQAALALGAGAVLRKPVSAAELAEAIGRLSDVRGGDGSADALKATLAELSVAARAELIRRGVDMAARYAAGEPPAAAEAHKIAGLAAQFGWPALADAAVRLERALSRDEAATTGAMLAFRLAVDCLGPALAKG